VGDDAEFVRAAAQMLAREGFEVACAAGAMQALFVLERKGPPDVVLCDLRLPGATGWALPEALRRQTGTFRGGLIACTTDAALSRKALQQAGFDAVVGEPLDAADLATAVRAFPKDPGPPHR